MRLFGMDFLDTEKRQTRHAREKKRLERIAKQCELFHLKEPLAKWDIIELPTNVPFGIIPIETEYAAKKIHEKLIKKKECHIFYDHKFCFHLSDMTITKVGYV